MPPSRSLNEPNEGVSPPDRSRPRKMNRFGLAGVVAVVLVAMIGAWLAWAFKSAQRRLDAYVAARRAAGEPMLPASRRMGPMTAATRRDRKSTRLNSSHVKISYA